MTDLPKSRQEIPNYLTTIIAEATGMESVEAMYTLRLGFDAAAPEIVRLARSCGGEMLIEEALESVAQYLQHRDQDLHAAALIAVDHLRLLLRQPGLW